MDKKITQRIIGILFALALIVILLPLLIEKKYSSPIVQTSEPSFPTTQNSVLAEKTKVLPPPTIPSQENINSDIITTKNNTINPEQDTVGKSITEKPVVEPPLTNPPVSESSIKEITTPENNSSKAPSASDNTQEKPAEIKPKEADGIPDDSVNDPKNLNKKISKKVTYTQIKSNSNAKLKDNLHKTAWIVQLGSFKNKNNAERLADTLRLAGYKAFMQEVKSSSGNGSQIRVYVGPQYKYAEASKISKQLEQDMKLQTYITTYKPLKL